MEAHSLQDEPAAAREGQTQMTGDAYIEAAADKPAVVAVVVVVVADPAATRDHHSAVHWDIDAVVADVASVIVVVAAPFEADDGSAATKADDG